MCSSDLLAIKVFADSRQCTIEKFLLDITEHNFISGARKNVRDAIAHRACANYTHSLNCHTRTQ